MGVHDLRQLQSLDRSFEPAGLLLGHLQRGRLGATRASIEPEPRLARAAALVAGAVLVGSGCVVLTAAAIDHHPLAKRRDGDPSGEAC